MPRKRTRPSGPKNPPPPAPPADAYYQLGMGVLDPREWFCFQLWVGLPPDQRESCAEIARRIPRRPWDPDPPATTEPGGEFPHTLTPSEVREILAGALERLAGALREVNRQAHVGPVEAAPDREEPADDAGGAGPGP